MKKLNKYGINSKIGGSIKLLYSYAKLKISNDSDIINANNGVLQGSLISPLLLEKIGYFDNLYFCIALKEKNEAEIRIILFLFLLPFFIKLRNHCIKNI